jgi:xanthine dehydrogenase accessory factor
LFADLLDRLERGERCVTAVSRDGDDRLLLAADGRISGAGAVHEVSLQGLRQAGKELRIPAIWFGQDGQWILAPWSGPCPLYVAGSGHVARTTSQMAAMVGFRVTVLDDRPELANLERFPQAHRICVVDMNSCLESVDVNTQASIVILTRGHVHDAEVLAQALRTDAGFIGMIGSRRKRDSIYRNLRGQGFSDADFDRVRCPIGLDIKAETPEEIAVSIVAQLIQFRACQEKEMACA